MTMRTRTPASNRSLVYLVDRGAHELGGVERDAVDHPLRKLPRQRRHPGADFVSNIECVCTRRQEYRYAGGRAAVQSEYLAIGLCTELHPADIADPRHLTGSAGLDDDVCELFGIVQPAIDIERILKRLHGGRRRRADLSGGDLLALLLQRVDDILGHQATRLQFLRIEPDPHGVLAGAEDHHVADTRQARELILQPDGGVIGEIEAVVAGVGRAQRDDLQDRRRLLLHIDALHLDRLRQRGQCRRHAVLHQHLREIQIGADVERYCQRVAAVVGSVRLHVDHALDAVDLLLDRQCDCVDHGPRAGARIAGRDLDGRRRDIGILRHRQAQERDQSDHDHQDGDDVRENRALDEELGDHGAGCDDVCG